MWRDLFHLVYPSADLPGAVDCKKSKPSQQIGSGRVSVTEAGLYYPGATNTAEGELSSWDR